MLFLQFLGNILRLFASLCHSVYVRIRYNSWTIAEYFRKQGAEVGKDCLIQVYTLGSEPYLITIGNNVLIGSGVKFHTHDGGTWIFRKEVPDILLYGKIIIEDNCVIGTDSHLFHDVTIGKGSIIGAGSVVITSIPPNSIAMGVPAKVIASTLKYRNKCIEAWKVQKPTDYNIEKDPDRTSKQIRHKTRIHLMKIFSDM